MAASSAGGSTEWLTVQSGRLKAQVYASPQARTRPVLVIVLHGDAPFNKPDYQYRFAQRAAASGNVLAAAILRPGYTDPSGDTSSGVRGLTTGDNYTSARIAMIATAIRELAQQYHARATVLVGHSGGAAIAADILALRPRLAGRALLVSCPCDVPQWRSYMKTAYPTPLWDKPVRSLSPLALASRVPAKDRVVMMVGTKDRVAPATFTQAYARALLRRGVDVNVVQLPGKGHEILLEPAVLSELEALLR
ncbi:MAG: alpha/beta fold hydrolase [Candidatus Eremiobacteraeota bacterium]|nr:alpha/beta fold hydrolase [Candidatus Eremiobacteraeota bacterium]